MQFLSLVSLTSTSTDHRRKSVKCHRNVYGCVCAYAWTCACAQSDRVLTELAYQTGKTVAVHLAGLLALLEDQADLALWPGEAATTTSLTKPNLLDVSFRDAF